MFIKIFNRLKFPSREDEMWVTLSCQSPCIPFPVPSSIKVSKTLNNTGKILLQEPEIVYRISHPVFLHSFWKMPPIPFREKTFPTLMGVRRWGHCYRRVFMQLSESRKTVRQCEGGEQPLWLSPVGTLVRADPGESTDNPRESGTPVGKAAKPHSEQQASC